MRHLHHLAWRDGGGDDDDDENDHEDLDTQAALGEQSFDEETAQAERQHQDDDSEVEERAFKLKVTAVVRVIAKATRFGLASASNPRCRPAVGGGGTAGLDAEVHRCARRRGRLHINLVV